MGNLLGSTALGHALMTLLSFLILLYCVRRFAWGPIMNVLEQRRKMIEKDIEEGRQLKESSDKANQEAKESLVSARIQASKIVNDAKKQGEELKRQLKEEAQSDIEAMRKQADIRLQREREQSLQEMEETVANVSVELAEKILQHDIQEEDHRRLINDFIHRLEDEVKHG